MTDEQVKALQDELADAKKQLQPLQENFWSQMAEVELHRLAKERDVAICKYEEAAHRLRHALNISRPEETAWRQFINWIHSLFGKQ